MKLLIALLISLGIEAFTYMNLVDNATTYTSNALGISILSSESITLSFIALVKLLILSCMVTTQATRSNLLIILLAICALFDCFRLTLFLNSAMYAMLIYISEFFGVVYRAVEVVCIVSIIFDAVCFLFHHNNLPSDSRGRNSTSRDIRVGDKI